MKLKQIVCDGTTLNLTKEKKVIKFGEVFDVDDERGEEILKATFEDKPVAELVKEEPVKNTKTSPGRTKKTK